METGIGALLSKEMFVSGTQLNYFLICNFIQKGNTLVLHEVKKGKRLERAHRYQLLYYLYYLNELKRVENVEGEIDYPLLRKKEHIVGTI